MYSRCRFVNGYMYISLQFIKLPSYTKFLYFIIILFLFNIWFDIQVYDFIFGNPNTGSAIFLTSSILTPNIRLAAIIHNITLLLMTSVELYAFVDDITNKSEKLIQVYLIRAMKIGWIGTAQLDTPKCKK